MPGVSLSLLTVDDARLAQLDATTSAPAWPGSGQVPARLLTAKPDAQRLLASKRYISHDALGPDVMAAALACGAALEDKERQLTDLDSAVGDGDLGISLRRGAEAVRALSPNCAADAASALTQVADALRRAIA